MTNYFLITLLLFTQIPGYHPELLPSPLKDVKIKSEVSLSKNGYFTYSYSVNNPATNDGRLRRIEIDVKKGSETVPIQSSGLPGNGKCSSIIASIINSGTVVPIGMDNPPNWSCGIGINGIADWGTIDYPYHLLPGQSLSGFVLTSYGLPGIRDIIARPLIVSSVYPNIDEFDVDMDELKKLMFQDKDKVSFHGKTIGPVAPPAKLIAVSFLDYIIDLKHQAVSLGWIQNDGVVNSLDVKLDNAKKKLSDGQPGAAKNILSAFISDVEAQGCTSYENCTPGKHLTSEAYALLKYNAQYLIDNLK